MKTLKTFVGADRLQVSLTENFGLYSVSVKGLHDGLVTDIACPTRETAIACFENFKEAGNEINPDDGLAANLDKLVSVA